MNCFIYGMELERISILSQHFRLSKPTACNEFAIRYGSNEALIELANLLCSWSLGHLYDFFIRKYNIHQQLFYYIFNLHTFHFENRATPVHWSFKALIKNNDLWRKMHWTACAASRINMIRDDNNLKEIASAWLQYKSPDGFRLVWYNDFLLFKFTFKIICIYLFRLHRTT